MNKSVMKLLDADANGASYKRLKLPENSDGMADIKKGSCSCQKVQIRKGLRIVEKIFL